MAGVLGSSPGEGALSQSLPLSGAQLFPLQNKGVEPDKL